MITNSATRGSRKPSWLKIVFVFFLSAFASATFSGSFFFEWFSGHDMTTDLYIYRYVSLGLAILLLFWALVLLRRLFLLGRERRELRSSSSNT